MSAPVQVGPSPQGGGPIPPLPGPASRQLTERQLRTIHLASLGQTQKQIARALGIDENSMGRLVSGMFRKLGARSMPHAVLLACRAGLLDGRPQRHGDHAGYVAHTRRGETPCDWCKEGESAYQADRRAGLLATKATAA